MGAEVEKELALLEHRLEYFEVRVAREQAKQSDRFPIVVVKSQPLEADK